MNYNLFTAATETTIADGGVILIIGMCVVFVVLILLMVIIHLMSAILRAVNKEKAQAASAPSAAAAAPAPVAGPIITAAPAAAPVPVSVVGPMAPGSCGSVALHTVPDRTAAMLMAIVADQMQVPLEELRFISIREIDG